MLYNTSIKLPYMFSLSNGNTELDTNFESINRSIAFILLTGKGELFGNPDFGSDLKLYQFREITPAVKSLISDEIVKAVTEFEDRIDFNSDDVSIEQIQDRLSIKISYSLKNSNLDGNAQVIIPLPTPQEV